VTWNTTGQNAHQNYDIDVLAAKAVATDTNYSSTFVYNNGVYPLNGTWDTAADGTWVGAKTNVGLTTNNQVTHDAGYYAYQTEFFLSTADYASVTNLGGFIRSDNDLLGILIDGGLVNPNEWKLGTTLNGQSYQVDGTTYNFGAINLGDYLDGDLQDHTLTFIVANYGWNANAANPGNANPTGILAGNLTYNVVPNTFIPREEGDTPVTPEPATILIFGLGMVGAAIARRRMMK
jgi:hypothetical protein